jgi:hypothetical protein
MEKNVKILVFLNKRRFAENLSPIGAADGTRR